MATTTCLKCGGHSFESVLFTPLGKNQKLAMIQCADCGVPVGAIDPSAELALAALRSQVAAIDEGLRRIASAL
jgi:hypothetical protein